MDTRSPEVPTTIIIRPSSGWSVVSLRELWRFRELLLFLVWRDLKVRYKQTALGAAWALVQPLAVMTLFTLVLQRLGGMPTDGLPAPLFYYTALVPWTYMAQGVNQGALSLVANQGLVTKVHFPRALIPLGAVMTPLVDLLVTLLPLAGLLAWYGTPPARPWALPLVIGAAASVVLGASLWLSALTVRFRDVKHTLAFGVQLWLFLTPVAYPLAMIPEHARSYYALNPAVGVVEAFRWATVGSSALTSTTIAAGAATTLLLLISGAVVFRRVERTLADVI